MTGLTLALGALCLGLVSHAAARSSHPARAALGGALLGLAALSLVNLTGRATGVVLPLNWLTAFTGVVLGAPGIAALLVVQVLVA